MPSSVRWHKLKKRKIVELDAALEHLRSMRDLLEQKGKRRCTALGECGEKCSTSNARRAFASEWQSPCIHRRRRFSERSAREVGIAGAQDHVQLSGQKADVSCPEF